MTQGGVSIIESNTLSFFMEDGGEYGAVLPFQVVMIMKMIVMTLKGKAQFKIFFASYSQPCKQSTANMLTWPKHSCVQITCNTLHACHAAICV